MDRFGNTLPLIRGRAEAQEDAGKRADFTKLAVSGDRLLEIRMGQGPEDAELLDLLVSHGAMVARLIERFPPEMRDKLAHKDLACRLKNLGGRERCGACG